MGYVGVTTHTCIYDGGNHDICAVGEIAQELSGVYVLVADVDACRWLWMFPYNRLDSTLSTSSSATTTSAGTTMETGSLLAAAIDR